MRKEFHYTAKDANGSVVTGTREALDRETVARNLLDDGLTPISIEVKNQTSIWKKKYNISIFHQKVTAKDLHLFCRQMYTMIRAGIPMTNALKRLSESTRNQTLNASLISMYESVAAGQSLSVAMQQHTKIFPSLLRHIISVGENTGRLDEAFNQIGDYLSLEVKTLSQLKAIMRYPAIVISAIVIAIMVVNVFVIPAFADLFKNFNAQLPIFTRILIKISEFIRHYWWLLLIATIGGAVALKSFLKTSGGKYWWDYYQLKIPAIGSILNRILYSRFSRTLMMILKTGVPITEGIGLVGNSMGNEYFRKAVTRMRDSMEAGENLTAAAREANVFPPMVIQMLMVGEESGELDKMMAEVATFYEREIDYEIEKLGDVIEPILLVVVGILVLLLALGVFLPIWELGAAARGNK